MSDKPHNQYARASSEFGTRGYVVRGTIVTHLTELARDAEASAGSIKVLNKDAILRLWGNAKILLSVYRDGWSLYDIATRNTAAQAVKARVPATGWIIRALDVDERFVTAETLTSEWR